LFPGIAVNTQKWSPPKLSIVALLVPAWSGVGVLASSDWAATGSVKKIAIRLCIAI
jgi:hypothetical protein